MCLAYIVILNYCAGRLWMYDLIDIVRDIIVPAPWFLRIIFYFPSYKWEAKFLSIFFLASAEKPSLLQLQELGMTDLIPVKKSILDQARSVFALGLGPEPWNTRLQHWDSVFGSSVDHWAGKSHQEHPYVLNKKEIHFDIKGQNKSPIFEMKPFPWILQNCMSEGTCTTSMSSIWQGISSPVHILTIQDCQVFCEFRLCFCCSR